MSSWAPTHLVAQQQNCGEKQAAASDKCGKRPVCSSPQARSWSLQRSSKGREATGHWHCPQANFSLGNFVLPCAQTLQGDMLLQGLQAHQSQAQNCQLMVEEEEAPAKAPVRMLFCWSSQKNTRQEELQQCVLFSDQNFAGDHDFHLSAVDVSLFIQCNAPDEFEGSGLTMLHCCVAGRCAAWPGLEKSSDELATLLCATLLHTHSLSLSLLAASDWHI